MALQHEDLIREYIRDPDDFWHNGQEDLDGVITSFMIRTGVSADAAAYFAGQVFHIAANEYGD